MRIRLLHLAMSGLTLLCYLSTAAQNRLISGIVTNAESKGVSSATVKVKDKPISTVTDPEGRFSLKIPAGRVTLEVSSVGFTPKSIDVDSISGFITIPLAGGNQNLSQVVVTALGLKTYKKALGYS